MGRGQLWCTILSHEPGKAVLSLSVMNVSSVITAPEGEKDRIAVHRGPKISIFFPFPPSLCTILPFAAKEKSPSEVTLRLSWTHMTLPLRILHPLCLTEVMKTKLLALCLFSVIFSVCSQQPEPWPFPTQGITVSSKCTQGWRERCRRQQPSWAYVKKLRSRPHQDLQCFVFKVLVIELRSCFSCCSEAETSCRVQCRDTVACKERDQSALQLHWSELMQEPAAAGAISISLGHAAGMKSVVEESWWASTWEMNWAPTMMANPHCIGKQHFQIVFRWLRNLRSIFRLGMLISTKHFCWEIGF